MQALEQADLTSIQMIACDVDETLTQNGRFQATTLECFERARELGLFQGIVTGRPFAWAQVLLEWFNLDFAIAENGAAALLKRDESIDVWHSIPDRSERSHAFKERDKALEEIFRTKSHIVESLDNCGRIYDRAYEISSLQSREELCTIENEAKALGLNFTYSSIHFHLWIGSHTKGAAIEELFFKKFKAKEILYLGDSANDASAFKLLPKSVGVANVVRSNDRLQQLDSLPKFVCDNPSSLGVLEALAKVQATRE